MTPRCGDHSLRYDRTVDAEEGDSLSEIAKLVRPASKVLDLGAATGALGKFLTERAACIVDGVLADAKTAAQARKYYRTLIELDLEVADLTSRFPAAEYDAIVLADVLEHLREPGRVLTQSHRLLAPGGRLLLSIPNVAYAGLVAELLCGEFRYRPVGLLDQTHVRFFTRKSLLDLLSAHGFGALSLRTVTQDPRDSEFDPSAFERVSPAVSQALLDAPDALAYQFIVEAAPGQHAPMLRPVPAGTKLRFGVQLFWAGVGNGFEESRSVAASGVIGEESQRLEIAVPPIIPAPTRLRLDVADRKGYLRIDAIRIESGRELLWEWDGSPCSLRMHDLVSLRGPLGATWLSTSNDPWVELPAPPDVLQRLASGGKVALEMGWPASADHALTASVLDEERRRWDVERRLLLDKLVRFHDVMAEAERREKQLAEMVARLERRVAALDLAQAHRSEALNQRLLALEIGSIRRTLRSIRSTIVRQRFAFQVRPGPHVRPVDGGRGEWEVTEADAWFELVTDARRLPIGWAVLHFELDGELPPGSRPRLYVDSGQGYSEASCIRLRGPVAGRIETLVQLPARVRSIRLYPIDRPGRFVIGALVLQEIGRIEVAARVLGPRLRNLIGRPQRLPSTARKAIRLFRQGGLQAVRARLIAEARGELGDRLSYSEWVERFDTLTEQDRRNIEARISALAYKPLLSIVMPTYETAEKWLRRAVGSVQAQLYPNWELCIADDASRTPQVRATLEEFARADKRIQVRFREQNGHISEASNTALELVRGEFIVLLDHDDELPPHALYRVVEELNEHPDCAIIYSDEDKIDERSQRLDPYFKSDWNPDLFCSHNMISHLGVYRTSLVRQVGGFRKGFEGSQDYDLALRIAEQVRPEQIRHIPAVLYHWRAIHGSTALSADHKSYAEISARKAIQEHLDRRGAQATVEPGPASGLQRVIYQLSQPPLVTIIIPTRDGLKLLKRCIDGIRERTEYPSWELIVVDNQSSEPATLRYLRELSSERVARILPYPGAFNYSAINNAAAREAKGAVLAFLNNDLDVISLHWLREMVSHVVRPEIGAVGAKLLYPDDTVQHAGILLGLGSNRIAGTPHRGIARSSFGHFGRAAVLQNFSAVTGACLVMRREVFETVGGFDETNLPVSYNDIDLCLRVLQHGLRVLWTPYAELYHLESATRGSDQHPDRRARFLREVQYMREKWGKLLDADPFYNPNLSLDTDQFDLAVPPRGPRPWDVIAG